MSITVLLADDQAMVRRGLRLILEDQEDISVVGEAADGAEAVELARRMRPDVCLVDIRMPKLDGIEVTRALAGPGVVDPLRVVIVTTFDLDEYVRGALHSGAVGFVLKDSRPGPTGRGCPRREQRRRPDLPSITLRLLRDLAPARKATAARPVQPLSAREIEVVRAIARGRTNQEIAAALFISLSTVKSHLATIQTKLQVRNRVETAAWAWESLPWTPTRHPDQGAAARRSSQFRLRSALSGPSGPRITGSSAEGQDAASAPVGREGSWRLSARPSGVALAPVSKPEIGAVTTELFGAFDHRGDKDADVARIRRLFLPSGVIVKTAPEFTVYTVDEFIEPRQQLLSDGRLVEFSEVGDLRADEVAGDIASRFGEYRKSGILAGEPFEGAGTKTLRGRVRTRKPRYGCLQSGQQRAGGRCGSTSLRPSASPGGTRRGAGAASATAPPQGACRADP